MEIPELGKDLVGLILEFRIHARSDHCVAHGTKLPQMGYERNLLFLQRRGMAARSGSATSITELTFKLGKAINSRRDRACHRRFVS